MQCKDNQNFDADLLLRIFFEVGDFSKEFEAWYALYAQRQSDIIISSKSPKKVRKSRLSVSEIVTLIIYYHHSGYKCFQYYYEALVKVHRLVLWLENTPDNQSLR